MPIKLPPCSVVSTSHNVEKQCEHSFIIEKLVIVSLDCGDFETFCFDWNISKEIVIMSLTGSNAPGTRKRSSGHPTHPFSPSDVSGDSRPPPNLSWSCQSQQSWVSITGWGQITTNLWSFHFIAITETQFVMHDCEVKSSGLKRKGQHLPEHWIIWLCATELWTEVQTSKH